MKPRHSIVSHWTFSGFAGAALAGTALLTAAPAFAQRDSTPAEQQQTQDLNSQALSASEDEADTKAYDEAKKNYEQQQENYNAQRQKYLDTKTSYDDNKAQSDESRAAYAAERAKYNAEHPEFPSDRDLVQLGTVAPRSLLEAPVESTDGAEIGLVARIRHHGHDMTLDIAVGSDRKISLLGDSLRFDRGKGVVLTASPGKEILAESQPGLPAR